MRFDPAAATLTASVGEVVGAAFPTRPGSRSAPWRALLGQRAHTRYAQLRAGEVEVAEVEASLVYQRSVASQQVTVRGRADLIVREGVDWVIEEVKSLSLTHDDERWDSTDFAAARFQSRLYALFLDDRLRAEGTVGSVRARVALMDLSEPRYQHLDAAYQRDPTLCALDEALETLVRVARDAQERSARRAHTAGCLQFPFERPREHQHELSELVSEGLEAGRPVLMCAPTGIGKTVAALLPALRFALTHDAQVTYLTAKTTQRAHVATTFEAIVRASELGATDTAPLRAITLRRKEEMCPAGHLSCHPRACPWLVDLDERMAEAQLDETLFADSVHVAPDALFDACTERTLCPHHVARRLQTGVDLVIGDFNHVFAASAASAEPQRRVVVVDEAHNLFDRAREHLSPFVGLADVVRLERWLSAAGPLQVATSAGALCQRLREALTLARKTASDDDAPCEDDQLAFEGCVTTEIDPSVWRSLAEEAAATAARWVEERWRQPLASPRDPLLDLAEQLASLAELLGTGEPELIAYVAGPTARRGRGVGVACVDPSRRLELQHRRALGVVAMSATLSPLPYYSDVLGLSRLGPLVTSAPSPFPHEHRRVLVVPTVSTTLRERDQSAPEIAHIIERVVAARSGCYAAYFSSFAFLSQVRQHLSLPPSEMLVQLPAMGSKMRDHTLEQLRSAPGRLLLLAVMGGVFGEGVDLPGEALVGAIVVGPGMPSVSFERALMQRHFDERCESGFAYAMVYPGVQRVIQAAGRVIRDDSDRGVIVLVGRRFAEAQLAACLPSDWYRHDPAELCCDDPAPALELFWRS